MKNNELLMAGGDNRREFTEKYLNFKGYKTVTLEKNGTEFFGLLSGENENTVILPLPVSRDGKNVNVSDRNTQPLELDFLAGQMKKGDTLIGGMIKSEIREKFEKDGTTVLDFYDDDYVTANAVLTAYGLMKVAKEEKIDFYNSKIIITGFGKTAKAIAAVLTDEKCRFEITARNDEAINLAKSMNYEAVKLKSITDKLPDFDIIVNTVPAVIIDEKMLYLMKNGAVVIDIASYPYGVDIELAKRYDIKVIRALSLPGRCFPEKAGELTGRKVESLLQGR